MARLTLAVAAFIQVLLSVSLAGALQPYTPTVGDPMDEPWRWRSFPELEGQGLRCLIEDAEGRMWFGVDRGVTSYDGLGWADYSAADGLWDAPVNALCVSGNGDLYAGSSLGISRLRDGKWTHVFPEDDRRPWPVNSVRETSDGSLWAGTSWGALRIRDGETTLFTSHDMAGAVSRIWPELAVVPVPDSAAPVSHYSTVMGSTGPQPATIGVQVVQEAWTGMSSRRASPVIWAVHPGGPADAAGLQVGDRILAINGIKDERASLLGGPPGTSVTIAIDRAGEDGPLGVVVLRHVVEGSSHDFPVYDVFQDRDGDLWLGMQAGEVVRCRFGPSGPVSWRLFDEADGLAVSYSPRIAQTPDGLIWRASNGGAPPRQFQSREMAGGIAPCRRPNHQRLHPGDL